MEVDHDSSMLLDQFDSFNVSVERHPSAFADSSYRQESLRPSIARNGIHMPQGCGLCWRERITGNGEVWQCFPRLAPLNSTSEDRTKFFDGMLLSVTTLLRTMLDHRQRGNAFTLLAESKSVIHKPVPVSGLAIYHTSRCIENRLQRAIRILLALMPAPQPWRLAPCAGCGARFHRQVNESGFRNREIHA